MGRRRRRILAEAAVGAFLGGDDIDVVASLKFATPAGLQRRAGDKDVIAGLDRRIAAR